MIVMHEKKSLNKKNYFLISPLIDATQVKSVEGLTFIKN